jgi:Ca2+-binding RTX toxin-like protein
MAGEAGPVSLSSVWTSGNRGAGRQFRWERFEVGTDILHGGAGNATMYTTAGSDKVYGDAGNDTITDYTHIKSYIYSEASDDNFDATRDNGRTNPFVADYVSGDLGYDVAVLNYDDIVTSSTERVIRQ